MDKTPHIMISAGHGYASREAGKTDPGADIKTTTRDEADWTLVFSRWLVADLKAVVGNRGAVYLRDAGYYAAVDDEAAKLGCDLLIENHLNSGGGTGTEVLYEDAKDALFAQSLSADIALALGLRDRGAKHRSDLAVLSPRPGMVQVIVEYFFADNKYDVNEYREKREKVELAVVNRVLRHYGWRTVRTLPRKWGRLSRLMYRPF